MIESLFERAHVRARLRSGPLGPYLDILVTGLLEKAYRPATICRFIRSSELFCCWLARRKISVAGATDQLVDRYIRRLGRHPCPGRLHGRLPDAAFGVRQLLEILRKEGVVAATSTTQGTEDRWLIRFADHLERTVGVVAGTRQTYLRYARLFLKSRFGSASSDLGCLTADDVASFVRQQASRLKPGSSSLPVTATRAFLRFLVSQNAVPVGLENAVPTIRQWKHTSLPKFLSEETVSRVVNRSEAATPVGRRNRAILLLLARLGLRATEVSRLSLEDINWKEGHLSIRPCKGGRGRTLPLPQDVGQALADYLQNGRPKSSLRLVFLRCRAPYVPLQAATISDVATVALQRAGVIGVRLGAHLLRHSIATGMVCRGASFKEVADVLGHERLETTAIYAKLDLASLLHVALPWPGGE